MGRIVYISLVNSIAIIAVIIGHLDITGSSNGPNTPISNLIVQLGSFQMPLFMCMSGYLFMFTSGYSKTYSQLMLSKTKRLIIPFLFLTLFTFIFKLCLPSSILEHKVGLSIEFLLKVFFVPYRGPVPHTWFLISLFTIFALSPIFKWSFNKKWKILLTLLVLLILHYIPTQLEIFAIDKTMSFVFWFYFGMVMQSYNILRYLKNMPICIFLGGVYIILNYFIHVPFVGWMLMSLFGILFIYSLSLFLSDKMESLFSSWRDYTYQIYLFHMYPIMACRYFYKGHFILNEDVWFIIIWLLALVLAIAIPTCMAKGVKRYCSKIGVLIGL